MHTVTAMVLFMLVLAAIAITGIVFALRAVVTDGYRRIPTAPICRNEDATHWR